MKAPAESPAPRSFFACAAAFRDGRDTPRRFLERCIASIEQHDRRIQAFVSLNLGGARTAADEATRRWKTGRPLSPIDGMPIGVKDIMETADLLTEQGSPLFQGWHGRRDAAAVAALREAGAAILGKTVTTEFAAAAPGPTRNPHDLERTPGGSSSGSAAAVGSGMVPAALGSQVVGSAIRPASFCGCYGYKPSVGAINRGGSFDEFSQSCTSVLAATLAEAWMVAWEMSHRAGGDPGYPGIDGPGALPSPRKPKRIAVLYTSGWERTTADARRAFEAARVRLGSAAIDAADRSDDPAIEAVEKAVANAFQLTMDINAWEGRWPLNTYARDMDRKSLSRNARDRLDAGNAMTLEKYRELIGERERVRATFRALRDRYDACITLAATGEAPKGIDSTGDPVFAVPGSLLGVPAVSLPVLQSAGLPLGLQVLGYQDEDSALLGFAGGLLTVLEGDRHG